MKRSFVKNAMRRSMVIAIFGCALFLFAACDSGNGAGTTESGSGESADPAPLLHNGDFEQSESGMPSYWNLSSWRANGVEFNYLPKGGLNGSAGVEIYVEGNSPNDAMWYQIVDDLKPIGLYNLYGFIKGLDITGNIGANLSNSGTWMHSGKAGSTGIFDWKQFVVTVEADENGTITAAARLGFWASESSGTATFDNISLLDEFESVESDYLHFQLEASDFDNISEASLAGWMVKLDAAYEAFRELVGGVPYDGAKIRINSVRQYPGGWAVAGNPIKWQQRYVGNELSKVNTNGDWSFGILHEIGHNFGLENRWVFAGEMLANLKMFYVVQTLNAKVSPNPINPEYYVGNELRGHYRKFFDDGINNGNYSWAGILYRLVLISDQFGWEIFKQTFRAFTIEAFSGTKQEKFNHFIEKLSEYAGEDISIFFTAGELAWISAQL